MTVVGDLDGALRAAAVSLEELRGQDEPDSTAVVVLTAGLVETAMGCHDDALGHLREARDLAARVGNAWLVTASRVQLGTLALVRGRPEEARALLAGAAEGLRQRVGLGAWPMLRRGEAELVAQVRQALGTDRFEQAVAAVGERRGAGTRPS